jgi:hypothetical protein
VPLTVPVSADNIEFLQERRLRLGDLLPGLTAE